MHAENISHSSLWMVLYAECIYNTSPTSSSSNAVHTTSLILEIPSLLNLQSQSNTIINKAAQQGVTFVYFLKITKNRHQLTFKDFAGKNILKLGYEHVM
jgi:hypothetical protein